MNTREIAAEYLMAYWSEIIEDRVASGTTIRKFCEQAGYKEHTYYYYYLTQHYLGMERHNADLAKCFYFYLAEQGMDCCKGLSDGEHKKLIRRQFKKFMDAWRDGFC